MDNRLVWVNNLKVIGILAVILGHISSPFGQFIFSWHMPLFFMIAGFFIKFNLPFKEFLSKDFKRLMIPYFIFSLIGLLAETIKRLVLHREELSYASELKGIFIWMDMASLINTYAFVLWFLPTLFLARLMLFGVKKYIKNIFIQFVFVSLLFSISFFVNLPFGLDNAFNALLFVYLGNIFFKFYQDNKLLYVLPFILVGLYIFFGIPTLDMATKNYSNLVINIFWSLSIVYTYILLLKKIHFSNKLLKIWGGNTMLLFIMHPYTNNIAHIIVEKIKFGDWYLKFFISLLLLHGILFIKLKYENSGVLKYV